jgi:hypothetical protein
LAPPDAGACENHRSDTTGDQQKVAACFARRVKLAVQKYSSFRKEEIMI